MNSNPKSRAIKWLNIVLLTVNLSAFATFIVMSGKPAEPAATAQQKISSLEFLREELKLDEKQYAEIAKQDDKVFRAYHVLVDLLCEAHFSLLDELAGENPSDEKLDSIAVRIGNLNASIKKQTIKHFIIVKEICDEKQSEQLSGIFTEMMEMNEQCAICNKKECPRKERLRKMK